MSRTIRNVHALEILDSRGNPTLSVEVELSDSTTGEAKVPSGASTGAHESVELRDGDPHRYAGRGVRQAVRNIHDVLAPELLGLNAEDQAALDRRMIELDGTPAKSKLGANAILGVSCAAARAIANSYRVPLWKYLTGGRHAQLPVPMVNIISGGLHAGSHIEFQDFLVVPHGFESFSAALEAVVAVHRAARGVIAERGLALTGVADEGGWGPHVRANEAALDILMHSIEHAGHHMKIAIDVAASHFFSDGQYRLHSERRNLSSEAMIDLLARWADRYPVVSIEDGLAEDDWEGWRSLTEKLGARLQLIGDDLFCTNPDRLKRGIESGAANAVLVKMNQIGTLTETFAVIDQAHNAGYAAVISARSGETEDDFLADLAVASGAGQIKVGSVTRSERLAKYNRLLQIERRDRVGFG